MGRKIPRTDDEVYALREYEVELSEDEITPIPTRKQNSGRRQMVAPAGGAKRELEVKRRSCCCRVMRGGLITLLVVINVVSAHGRPIHPCLAHSRPPRAPGRCPLTAR